MFEYATTMAVESPPVSVFLHFPCGACSHLSTNDSNDIDDTDGESLNVVAHCGGSSIGPTLLADIRTTSRGPAVLATDAVPYDSGGSAGGGMSPHRGGGDGDGGKFGSSGRWLDLTRPGCAETPGESPESVLGTAPAGLRQISAANLPLLLQPSPARQVRPNADSVGTDDSDGAGGDDSMSGHVGQSAGGGGREQVVAVAGSVTMSEPASSPSSNLHKCLHPGDADVSSACTDITYDEDDSNSCSSSNNNNHNLNRHGSLSTTSSATTTIVSTEAVTNTDTGGGPVRSLRVRGQRRFVPEKTRHKRQTLQDMTRPLKQWLLKHKDNPYPSKAEKLELVSCSQMTLTQVSNWFANARRRLKNTVKQPDLSWASRIKLYNSYVQGNAELFSLASDDSCLESDDDMLDHRQSDTFPDDITDSLPSSSRTATPDIVVAALGSRDACGISHSSSAGSSSSSLSSSTNQNHGRSSYSYQMRPHHQQQQQLHHQQQQQSSTCNVVQGSQYSGVEVDACASFPKYKHSILHRYLSDAHHQPIILDEDAVAKSRDRHHSSSTGSRDIEDMSTSSVSSPAHEMHHDPQEDFSEDVETMALRRRTSEVSSNGEGEMYWKEIGAALALTSLARGRFNNV